MNIKAILSENGYGIQPLLSLGSRYSHKLPNIAKKIGVIALAAISILAVESIPQVNAGPFAYAACIAACESVAAAATVATAGAAAGSLMACVAACAPVLPLPFPP